MNTFKKLITLVCLSALCTSLSPLNAQGEDIVDNGSGYESSRKAPSVSPTLVLAGVAAAALVAVLVQNKSHGGHNHSH